jgi:hypothetical protein
MDTRKKFSREFKLEAKSMVKDRGGCKMKRERVHRKVCLTSAQAKAYVFEFIEAFSTLKGGIQ